MRLAGEGTSGRVEIAMLSRASLLNFHLALEALQNRVYSELVAPRLADFSRLPIERLLYSVKWYIAPLLTVFGAGAPAARFKVNAEPWQTVMELAEIRNAMVHRKAEFLKDPVWPQTKIPRYPELVKPDQVRRVKKAVDASWVN